jgi:tetratricopeptide (TPR) repeat protein
MLLLLQKKSDFIAASPDKRPVKLSLFFLIFFVLLMQIPVFSFTTVVIFPFQNQLTDKKLYWLPRGFANTTATTINCPDDYILQSEDIDEMYAQLGLAPNMDLTYATLIKMTQLNDIHYALFGAMKNVNNIVKIDAKIFITKSSTIVPISLEGNLNNILGLQSQLTKALIDFFNAHGIKAFSQTDVFKDITPYSFEMYIKGQQEEKTEIKIKFLKQALKENKTFAPAILAIAQAYYAMEDYDNALQYLSSIPANSPFYSRALFTRATIYAHRNENIKALEYYLEASKYQRSSSLFNNMAVILIKQNDFEHARWYMNQALSVIADDYDLILNHAILALLSNDYKTAKTNLLLYLNKYPENLIVYLMLEYTAHKENNEISASIILDLASKHNDFALVKEKFNTDFTTYLVYQYNLDEELIKQYKNASNKLNNDTIGSALQGYKNRAQENIKSKEFTQSLDDLFTAALKTPFDWELYFLIGKIYYLTNDTKNAEKYLTFSLWCKDNPDSAKLLSDIKSNQAKP